MNIGLLAEKSLEGSDSDTSSLLLSDPVSEELLEPFCLVRFFFISSNNTKLDIFVRSVSITNASAYPFNTASNRSATTKA